jgi:hypothetical protein
LFVSPQAYIVFTNLIGCVRLLTNVCVRLTTNGSASLRAKTNLTQFVGLLNNSLTVKFNDTLQTTKHPLSRMFVVSLVSRLRGIDLFVHLAALLRGSSTTTIYPSYKGSFTTTI